MVFAEQVIAVVILIFTGWIGKRYRDSNAGWTEIVILTLGLMIMVSVGIVISGISWIWYFASAIPVISIAVMDWLGSRTVVGK
ncbi:MAG: hypothetical protein R3B38_01040 [Patescibacteria group bacterium]